MLGGSAPEAGATTTSDDDRLVLVFGNAAETNPVAEVPGLEGSPAGAEPVEGVDYHVVTEGETLSSIAQLRWGDSLLAKRLAELNGLADPDSLLPGQVLRLR